MTKNVDTDTRRSDIAFHKWLHSTEVEKILDAGIRKAGFTILWDNICTSQVIYDMLQNAEIIIESRELVINEKAKLELNLLLQKCKQDN